MDIVRIHEFSQHGCHVWRHFVMVTCCMHFKLNKIESRYPKQPSAVLILLWLHKSREEQVWQLYLGYLLKFEKNPGVNTNNFVLMSENFQLSLLKYWHSYCYCNLITILLKSHNKQFSQVERSGLHIQAQTDVHRQQDNMVKKGNAQNQLD